MTILDRSRSFAEPSPVLQLVPADSEPDVPAGRLVGEIASPAVAEMEARMQDLARTIGDPPSLLPQPADDSGT